MNFTCYIVDDEFHNIATLQQHLKNIEEFKIIGTSTDPRVALDEIIFLKPDVVFSDINMPWMSGIELAKQTEDFTLTVFVTAERSFTLAENGMVNSIIITKPVSLKKFELAINDIKNRLNSYQ